MPKYRLVYQISPSILGRVMLALGEEIEQLRLGRTVNAAPEVDAVIQGQILTVRRTARIIKATLRVRV